MLGKVLVFLGGLLVVVLFLALLAPLFIDWTDFRKNFEDQASRIIGKKVTVHGTVDARLLPFPSVTLHDVRVGQEEDGTPLVQIAQFSMDAELAPFLSGEALIFDMRISQPKVRLRLLKDGTLDWMRGSQAEIPAKTVVLENVHVDGGDIQFIDEQSGRTRHVTGFNAEMSAKSLAGPWRIEGDASLDGEHGNFTLSSSQPDDNGVLRVRTRLQPDRHPLNVDLDGELKLINSRPDYIGFFTAGIEDKETHKPSDEQVQPRAKGRFELTNERIRVPEYRLEVGAADDPYVVTGEATLDTGSKPEFLLTADGQQIDVNRLGNTQGTTGKTTRNPAVSARQRLNSLIAIAAEIPIPQVPGKATFRLPAIVAGDTTIRDVQLDLEPAGTGWKIDHAIGTLPGRTQVEAKGNLTLQGEPNFIGNLVVASNQPSGLASWLAGSVDPAIRQLRQAGFSADVDLRHEEQRFENLEIAVGSATLKGQIDRQAQADNQPPKLAVDLSGDALDLDALRALTSLFTGQDAGDTLLDHRITAHLKADKFAAFGVQADNVETSFGIADGALTLDKLTVSNVAGAEITATGRADGSLLDYKGSGEITFKAADPGPFFEMLSQHLPHHPALDRLVRNAAWYGNTALRGALTLGGDQGDGLAVTLAGVSNGSRVNLDYRMSDLLALTGKGTTTLEATLENSVTSILFGQAGLDPLPVDADANGRLTLKVTANGTDPADAALTFATDKTSFTANGKVDVRPNSFLNGNIVLSLESADIDPYFVMNGIGVPQMGTGLPVKFQANATLDADKVVLSDMKGLLADNNVSG
ncbi:MAG: AsmA family protein, partial [Rhizobiaceae bacterium]|nr:AsmA family protein [Rhizobiaceae bacterium]